MNKELDLLVSFPRTNTTLFLFPVFEIERDTLLKCGFVDAYIKDDNHIIESDHHLIYALFKPHWEDYHLYDKLVDQLDEKGILLDEYDYEDGYTVMVLEFPYEYNDDYNRVMKGEYSKCSKEFKDLFPTFNLDSNVPPEPVASIQSMVFEKQRGLFLLYEEIIGETNVDFEFWRHFDEEKEELKIENILNKQ